MGASYSVPCTSQDDQDPWTLDVSCYKDSLVVSDSAGNVVTFDSQRNGSPKKVRKKCIHFFTS